MGENQIRKELVKLLRQWDEYSKVFWDEAEGNERLRGEALAYGRCALNLRLCLKNQAWENI